MQKPTLQLNFAGSRTKDPRITHTRSSAAYETAPDGLLRKVPADTMRFMHDLTTGKSLGYLPEEARTNGIQQPNDFTHANWVKTTGGTGSAPKVYPYAGEAPDGSWSATRVDFALNGGTTTSDQSNLYYILSSAIGQPTCAAIWLKTIDGSTKTFRFDFLGNSANVPPYDNNTLTVTGEWQRFIIANSNATDIYFRIMLRLRGAIGTSDSASVLIWNAYQQNNVTSPTSDIPDATAFVSRASTKTVVGADGNLTTIGIDEAPWSYNPLRLSAPPALMYEVSRTNLLTYSEQFDNAAWTKSRLSGITANAVVSPDGTLTADKLVEDTTLGAHYVASLFYAVASLPTGSVYVKAAERSFALLQIIKDNGANFASPSDFSINLTTGEFTGGSGANPTVTNAGNGWWRISLTATSTATINYGIRVSSANADGTGGGSYTGDGTSGIYIWGAQLEAGDYPSSYIPTTTTTVTRAAEVVTYSAATRAADVAYIDGQNFLDFYNQSEGTFVVDAIAQADTGAFRNVLSANDGGFQDSIILDCESTRIAYGYVITDSVLQSAFTKLNVPTGTHYKTATAYAENDVAGSYNGEAVLTDSSVQLPVNLTRLSIGCSPTSFSQANAPIARITYYPKRLDNTTLVKLSEV